MKKRYILIVFILAFFFFGYGHDVIWKDNNDGSASYQGTAIVDSLNSSGGIVASDDIETSGNVTAGNGINYGSSTEYTIASGVITITAPGRIVVDTENDDASDNLLTINGGADGDMIYLQTADSSRDVWVNDATGNMNLTGHLSLSDVRDTVTLMYDGNINEWIQMGYSDNN